MMYISSHNESQTVPVQHQIGCLMRFQTRPFETLQFQEKFERDIRLDSDLEEEMRKTV